MTHRPYLVGLVGTGVGPSLTPALHMAEARAQGLDYVYRTIDLNDAGHRARADRRAARLGAHARLRRPQHHPPVQAARHRAPRRPRRASRPRLGAVNTVRLRRARRAVGYNTDTTGFAHRLRRGPARRTPPTTWCCSAPAARARPSATRCCGSAPSTSPSSTSTSTAPPRSPTSWPSRHPTARVDASTPDKLSVLLPASDGLVHCTPDRHGRPPRAAVRPPSCCTRAVGGRHRLPAAGHRTAAGRARRRAAAPSTAATWPSTRPPTPSP